MWSNQLRWWSNGVQEQATRLTIDDQILLQNVNDVGVVKPSRNVEPIRLISSQRVDSDENAVDRVVHDHVSIDIWTAPAVVGSKETAKLIDILDERRLQEGIGIGRNRGVCAPGNRIVGDRRSAIGDMNWIDQSRVAIDHHVSSAKSNVGVVHVIEEYPLVLIPETVLVSVVQVGTEHDAAPIPWHRVRGRVVWVRVNADHFVKGRQDDIASKRSPLLVGDHSTRRVDDARSPQDL